MSAPTEITRDPLDWEPCCYRPISSTAADNKETTIFKKMFVCHLSETSLESFVCYRKRAWVMWIILVEPWCQNAKAVSLPFPLFLIIPYILVWLLLIQIFMCNIKPERLFVFCQPYFLQFLNADQSPWLNDKISEKRAKSYLTPALGYWKQLLKKLYWCCIFWCRKRDWKIYKMYICGRKSSCQKKITTENSFL